MIEAGYERGNLCRSFRGKRCSVWLVVTFVVLASMYQQHLIKSIDHIYTAESASPKGLFLSFTVLLGWAALFTAAFSVNFMIPPDPLGLCLSRFAGCSGSNFLTNPLIQGLRWMLLQTPYILKSRHKTTNRIFLMGLE
jgi:hypothetical protein